MGIYRTLWLSTISHNLWVAQGNEKLHLDLVALLKTSQIKPNGEASAPFHTKADKNVAPREHEVRLDRSDKQLYGFLDT